MKKRQSNKQKGLTDAELVAKYGKGGRVAFKNGAKAMLATPNPNAPEKNKKGDIS